MNERYDNFKKHYFSFQNIARPILIFSLTRVDMLHLSLKQGVGYAISKRYRASITEFAQTIWFVHSRIK